MNKPKVIFISWAPHCSRSDNIAREFGGKSYMVYYGFFGSNYLTVAFKYLFQAAKTWKILMKEKPDVVFVMSPPVFACVPVYIYCKFFKKIYLIDAHTGALLNPMWKPVMFLQKFFSKKAIVTIVTNKYLENIIKGWGGNTFIITDVPIKFPNVKPKRIKGFNITFINTFADNEPLEIVLETAKRLPQINFFITGRLKDAPSHLIKQINQAPKNVKFTDFLPYAEYVALLKSSDATIILTTEDHTMLRGAYESIYLGKPIIISDFDFLKRVFYKGAVYIDNTANGLQKGIIKMIDKYERYQKEVQELKSEKLNIWISRKQELKKIIENILKNV